MPGGPKLGGDAADVFAEFEAEHKPLPVIDALIAATARVYGMAVVTRNVKDFELAGVQVLNPFTDWPASDATAARPAAGP